MKPFVDALVEGKTIQINRGTLLGSDWEDVDLYSDTVLFDHDYLDRLRVKPDAKWRPWKPGEYFPSMIMQRVFPGCVSLVLSVDEGGVVIWYRYEPGNPWEINIITWQALLNFWEHSTDGGKTWRKCGVEE